jgi:hypothetical protein
VSLAAPDRFAAARSVADAVLYEGYVLYPYRASSRKNQVRFQWGVLTPRAFSQAEGSERWFARTECLIDPGRAPILSVRVRCLQMQRRRVEALVPLPGATYTPATFEPVDYLEVDGTLHVDWDEAVDQVVDLDPLALFPPRRAGIEAAFSFHGATDNEPIEDADGTMLGRFVRRRQEVEGVIRVMTETPDPRARYVKVSVTVENTSAWDGTSLRRDDAMGQSLVAVHTMLAVDDGRFISLLDPPEDADVAVRSCASEGAYPVLIGDEDVVLASPIILYDHPEVAEQSPGDLYDSLEIDEILALRVMTLTDQEKSEARGTDPRAAAIIDRCDDLSAETLSQLHGQMRPVALRGATGPPEDPASFGDFPTLGTEPAAAPWWDPAVDAAVDPWTDTIWVHGMEVAKGAAVRLRPTLRSDAQDMFLHGLSATVAGVFTDVDGETHVAVTVDDDPATEELRWQGRYLFFHPDEVEPLLGQEQDR